MKRGGKELDWSKKVRQQFFRFKVELKQSIPNVPPTPHSSNCLGDSLRLEMKQFCSHQSYRSSLECKTRTNLPINFPLR